MLDHGSDPSFCSQARVWTIHVSTLDGVAPNFKASSPRGGATITVFTGAGVNCADHAGSAEAATAGNSLCSSRGWGAQHPATQQTAMIQAHASTRTGRPLCLLI